MYLPPVKAGCYERTIPQPLTLLPSTSLSPSPPHPPPRERSTSRDRIRPHYLRRKRIQVSMPPPDPTDVYVCPRLALSLTRSESGPSRRRRSSVSVRSTGWRAAASATSGVSPPFLESIVLPSLSPSSVPVLQAGVDSSPAAVADTLPPSSHREPDPPPHSRPRANRDRSSSAIPARTCCESQSAASMGPSTCASLIDSYSTIRTPRNGGPN